MNEPAVNESTELNSEEPVIAAPPAKMRLHITPNTKWIVGRIVDIDMSQGGIELVTGAVKGVTVFLLVDEIGPDVKHAKVGDIILYKSMNHVITRDGQHLAVVLDDEDNVVGTVDNLDPERISIEGEEKKRPANPAAPGIRLG